MHGEATPAKMLSRSSIITRRHLYLAYYWPSESHSEDAHADMQMEESDPNAHYNPLPYSIHHETTTTPRDDVIGLATLGDRCIASHPFDHTDAIACRSGLWACARAALWKLSFYFTLTETARSRLH